MQGEGTIPLKAGYFGNLERYPFHNPVRGGLDWSGNGRGCSRLTGWFAIDRIVYTGTAMTAVEMRFEQHCEGMVPALRGAIRWSKYPRSAYGGRPVQSRSALRDLCIRGPLLTDPWERMRGIPSVPPAPIAQQIARAAGDHKIAHQRQHSLGGAAQ